MRLGSGLALGFGLGFTLCGFTLETLVLDAQALTFCGLRLLAGDALRLFTALAFNLCLVQQLRVRQVARPLLFGHRVQRWHDLTGGEIRGEGLRAVGLQLCALLGNQALGELLLLFQVAFKRLDGGEQEVVHAVDGFAQTKRVLLERLAFLLRIHADVFEFQPDGARQLHLGLLVRARDFDRQRLQPPFLGLRERVAKTFLDVGQE